MLKPPSCRRVLSCGRRESVPFGRLLRRRHMCGVHFGRAPISSGGKSWAPERLHPECRSKTNDCGPEWPLGGLSSTLRRAAQICGAAERSCRGASPHRRTTMWISPRAERFHVGAEQILTRAEQTWCGLEQFACGPVAFDAGARRILRRSSRTVIGAQRNNSCDCCAHATSMEVRVAPSRIRYQAERSETVDVAE